MNRKEAYIEVNKALNNYKTKLKNSESKKYLTQARQHLDCCEFLEDLKTRNYGKSETKTK